MRFDLRPEDHALIEAALAFGGAHPATADDQRAAIATLRAALRRLPDTPEICDAEYNLMVMPAAWEGHELTSRKSRVPRPPMPML